MILRLALALIAAIVLMGGALSACQRSLLYFPNRAEVAPTLAGVSAVRIETEDGETLIGWWRAPAAEGAPVFLFFDGNGGRPEAWNARWAAIARGGAGFLALYYRGYSGSTGQPSEAGLHADARAGYDWLIAQGHAPGEIVIHGLSLGSGVAVRLASERPARALILEAPFTGVDDVAALHYTPLARLIVRDRFASRDYIAAVAMPVLIVHGEADRVIPITQGERLYALARAPKLFVAIPDGGHTDLIDAGLYDHVWRFLAQHPGS